jgi:hypothetical protein
VHNSHTYEPLVTSRRSILFLRGSLKTKYFDVDLKWVAKHKNREMSVFHGTDPDEEECDMLKVVTGKGSVDPDYREILMKLVEEGGVVLWEYAQVKKGLCDSPALTWTLGLETKTGRQRKRK